MIKRPISINSGINVYDWYLYSPRTDYGVVPTFHHGSDLPKEGFRSLYSVTKETSEAIVEEGTTRGFKGIVWSPRLWLDFDSQESTRRAESRLKEMQYDFIGYDTGNRGSHFGILRNAAPSHLLPARDKQWVKEYFPEADHSIYTHLHPFRLAGTVHEKTGNRKRMVCQFGGSTLSLPPLAESTMQVTEEHTLGRDNRSVFDSFRIMGNTVPVKNGERHHTMIRLLYALKGAGVEVDKALWWIQEWNKMLEEPKEENEIQKAIEAIYR